MTVREGLNRNWRRLFIICGLLAVAVTTRAALNWERSWYLSFNLTESLPHLAYVIDRNGEPQVGDYIDFWPPENPYYRGISFVKQIVAGPGDDVQCAGRKFLLDGEVIAVAKRASQAGDPLSLGPCGVVPPDRYFVTTPHKDSFDSRYGEIGYVSRDRVRGVARPVL